ncbi:pseudouridine synthase, partial [Arthrobacter sp. Br18]|uniref:pseudouridine synthase n=1 Tax=Arthrobacter sp. Br18 TaxID=1312954 RepID=UPI0020A63BB3
DDRPQRDSAEPGRGRPQQDRRDERQRPRAGDERQRPGARSSSRFGPETSGRPGSSRDGSSRSSTGRLGEARNTPGRSSAPGDGSFRDGPSRNSEGAGRSGAGRTGDRKFGAARPSGGKPGAGKPGAAKTGRPARQKPAGPKAFGRERFGKDLGPVRRPKPVRSARPADEVDVHDPEGVRLQKVMALAGVASRRVCEEMILDGRVEVDGSVVTELGVRVDPEKVAIHVDGMRLQLNELQRYYVFNKPRGVVSTMEDPDGRPCIGDFLKNKSKNERLFHVGRLDAETEGLLLLTNDGELTNRLTHPSYEVPKTYLVQVRGPMAQGIGARMKEGIELEDGVARVDSFKLVDSTPGHILVEVVLHSGRNRVIRRLFDAVGHPVERLVRTQVGPIRVGDQRQGSIRVLGRQEVGHLLASVGL